MTGEIRTQEQATAVVREFCRRAVEARGQCNVEVPGDSQATASAQQAAYRSWLMNYGSAVGALTVLHRALLISDSAFELLSAEVFATLAPTVVGDLSSPILPFSGIVRIR